MLQIYRKTASQSGSVMFWIGVAIELVAASIQNIGLNLQKLAHRRQLQMLQQKNSALDLKTLPNYCINTKWWTAIGIFIAGIVLDFAALSFIPSSVSLPVGSLGLAVSAICATMWLHESFYLLDLIGTLCVIAGSFFVIIFSTKEMALLTIDTFNAKFSPQNSALWFFVALCILFCIVTAISYCFKNAFIYGLVPGVTGGLSILFSGMVGQMLMNTFSGNSQMGGWQIYIAAVCMFIALFTVNYFLQRALRAFDNMLINPIYFTTMLIVSVTSGIWYFQIFEGITLTQGIMFGAGCVIIITGCILLSIHHIGSREVNFGPLVRQEQFINVSQYEKLVLEDELK